MLNKSARWQVKNKVNFDKELHFHEESQTLVTKSAKNLASRMIPKLDSNVRGILLSRAIRFFGPGCSKSNYSNPVLSAEVWRHVTMEVIWLVLNNEQFEPTWRP